MTTHLNPQHRAAVGRLPNESLDDLFKRLETSREGLHTDEADRRLSSGGANEFQTTRLRSEIVELIRGSANPLVIILLIAGLASAILGEVTDAVIIGGIVLLSAGINGWQAFRSQRAVSRLRDQVAPTATVRRDGLW